MVEPGLKFTDAQCFAQNITLAPKSRAVLLLEDNSVSLVEKKNAIHWEACVVGGSTFGLCILRVWKKLKPKGKLKSVKLTRTKPVSKDRVKVYVRRIIRRKTVPQWKPQTQGMISQNDHLRTFQKSMFFQKQKTEILKL